VNSWKEAEDTGLRYLSKGLYGLTNLKELKLNFVE